MIKKILVLGIITGIVAFLAYIGFAQTKNSNFEKVPNNEEIVYFYGNTCPHCKEVEEFINNNKIKEKLPNLVEKEVYDNRQNAQELKSAAKKCNLDQSSIPVPFLFAEGKCFIGTPDVISYLSQKAVIEAKEATKSATSSGEIEK